MQNDLREIAACLAQTTLVFIGGQVNVDAKAEIERSFGLRRLRWIATRKHQSTKSFESIICRADVKVVVLLTRWASHSFGDVHLVCKRLGKPSLNLRAGYNPRQLAYEIKRKCGRKLGLSVQT